MYKIERKAAGYYLTFSGLIPKEEMRRWVEDSRRALEPEAGPFGVIVDMTALSPVPPEVQEILVEGQRLYKERGMVRSSVVVNSAATARQFMGLAKTSGIYLWERYMDGSNRNCFATALAWVKDGVDPDARRQPVSRGALQSNSVP